MNGTNLNEIEKRAREAQRLGVGGMMTSEQLAKVTGDVFDLVAEIEYMQGILYENDFVRCAKCGAYHQKYYICEACGYDGSEGG